MNYEYQSANPNVKLLTSKDLRELEIVDGKDPLRRTIYLLPSTGEYLRQVQDMFYEVLYTPYNPSSSSKEKTMAAPAMVGKREDTIIMDDVTTDSFLSKDAFNFWAQPLQESMNKGYKAINDELTKALLYGTNPRTPKGIKTFISDYKTPAYKEQDMEIGGSVCHLCGAKLIQHNCDIVYKKRHHVRNIKRYECGTIVEKGYKSQGEGYQMEDPYSKVILGDDCVEI